MPSNLATLPALHTQYYAPSHASPATLNEIGLLRASIWQDHQLSERQHACQQVWLEEADRHAHLWGVTSGSGLIATARLCISDNLDHLPEQSLYQGLSLSPPFATMGRLVVTPAWRGKGIATALIRERLSLCDRLGVKSLLLDCPEHRVPVMQRFGFNALKLPQAGVLFPDTRFVVMGRFN
ncbi:GNAT family N-acetyltransferase [Pseudoalteromonas fenneropenaei]|uniref:GNAT family N-acetyltransferase n=1 Tax=Pseudoalteromonas fenneropenaei TaxID=1737459 RepID=A0ABV7CQ38_9GAMM